MQIAIVLSLVIAVAAAVFALQNPTVVDLRFINLHFSGSVALLLILSFVAGFVSKWLLGLPAAFRRRRTHTDLKRRVADLERVSQQTPPPPASLR
ncbi:MAG: LapA family protein [Elusimicrobia bacterium]|nr:LapA family protein [Elusimicrobiota bacterium]